MFLPSYPSLPSSSFSPLYMLMLVCIDIVILYILTGLVIQSFFFAFISIHDIQFVSSTFCNKIKLRVLTRCKVMYPVLTCFLCHSFLGLDVNQRCIASSFLINVRFLCCILSKTPTWTQSAPFYKSVHGPAIPIDAFFFVITFSSVFHVCCS